MKRNTVMILVALFIIALAVLLFLALRNNAGTKTSSYTNTTENLNTNTTLMNNNTNTAAQQTKLSAKPVITMQTSLGTVTIKLYTADAPELTKNFLELAKTGYY